MSLAQNTAVALAICVPRIGHRLGDTLHSSPFLMCSRSCVVVRQTARTCDRIAAHPGQFEDDPDQPLAPAMAVDDPPQGQAATEPGHRPEPRVPPVITRPGRFPERTRPPGLSAARLTLRRVLKRQLTGFAPNGGVGAAQRTAPPRVHSGTTSLRRGPSRHRSQRTCPLGLPAPEA
jgi:hypothetical protein